MAHTGPARVASVINQMPFLRTDNTQTNMERAVHLVGVLSTAREAAQRYRAAVLAHDDLAGRLARLLRLTRPEHWNGYVPPRTDGYGAYNSSPVRQVLVQIVAEALDRENDWRGYDSDRVATVPDRHIKAPWTEQPGAVPTREEAGLWPESDR